MTSLSNPKHRDQPLHCVAETTAPRASFEKDWPTCNYLQQMGGKSENFTIWLNILILRWNKLSLPFANRLQVISKRGNSWSGFVPDRFHHEKRWWRRLPRTHPWISSTSRLSVGHHHQCSDEQDQLWSALDNKYFDIFLLPWRELVTSLLLTKV